MKLIMFQYRNNNRVITNSLSRAMIKAMDIIRAKLQYKIKLKIIQPNKIIFKC